MNCSICGTAMVESASVQPMANEYPEKSVFTVYEVEVLPCWRCPECNVITLSEDS